VNTKKRKLIVIILGIIIWSFLYLRCMLTGHPVERIGKRSWGYGLYQCKRCCITKELYDKRGWSRPKIYRDGVLEFLILFTCLAFFCYKIGVLLCR
jgi:hypothetical protein